MADLCPRTWWSGAIVHGRDRHTRWRADAEAMRPHRPVLCPRQPKESASHE